MLGGRITARDRRIGLGGIAVAIACAAFAVPARERAVPAAAAVADADDLRIVDCLLPGQVRRLGNRQTYVTRRRPARLPAVECRIRGGEYVAYDRANLSAALEVWSGAARDGDAQAQNYVGEMYQKGLGVPPDHAEAAAWYRRAADQGLAAAQINLGFLYEQGLGVERDPAEALRWYRRAAGLSEAVLLDGDGGEAAALREEAARLRAEVDRLTARVAALEDDLAATRSALGAAREQRDRTERDLREREAELDRVRREAAAGVGDAAQVARLEAELSDRVRALDEARAEVARLESRVETSETEAARAKELQAEIDRRRREAEAARREADLARERLVEVERSLEEQRAAGERLAAELDRARAEAAEGREDAGRVAALEGLLDEREREIVRLEAAVADGRARVAEVEREREDERRRREQAIAAGELAPPAIEIIDPPVLRTRGVQTIAFGLEEREIVGRVTAPAGLVSFHVNDRPCELDDRGLFRVPVRIAEDPTRVAVVAVDRQGKRSTFEFDLTAGGGGAAGTRSPEPDVQFGDFHALVIGNDDYARMPDLQTARRDADAVAAVLRDRYGFETTVLHDADRYQVLSALNDLRKRLDEDDNLVVYYAGHGELDDAVQRGYWLPVDADPDNPANWVSTTEITDQINVIPARHVLVIADSCYSGTLTRSSLARLETGMSPEARRNWLRQLVGKRSRTALSSGGIQPVLDAGGGGNSVFARALLDVLRENDDILEGMRLYREVSARVAYASQALGLDQVPEYAPVKFAGHESGDFFFVPRRGR